MKVLFIGLGSIGQRHLQNFNELRPEYSTVLAYRTSKSDKVIKNGNVIPNKKLSQYYNLIEFSDLNKAICEHPDIAFICNPSRLHLETALKLAENNIHLFIEKPLATSLSSLDDLDKCIDKNVLINMVGYQTRFNPLVLEARNHIKSLEYGEIIKAEFKWHTYLPDQHPYEDYRRGYAARKDLGGGVTFSLIHELDLIQWFFGLPISVYSVKGGPSKLKIDADDNISAIFNCYNGLHLFPVQLSLSFTQKFEERYFNVLMQDALLKVDLVKNEIEIIEHTTNRHYHKKKEDFERNSLFKDEMEEFITAVENNQKTSIPISEGKKSVIMAISMIKSFNKNIIVNISL